MTTSTSTATMTTTNTKQIAVGSLLRSERESVCECRESERMPAALSAIVGPTAKKAPKQTVKPTHIHTHTHSHEHCSWLRQKRERSRKPPSKAEVNKSRVRSDRMQPRSSTWHHLCQKTIELCAGEVAPMHCTQTHAHTHYASSPSHCVCIHMCTYLGTCVPVFKWYSTSMYNNNIHMYK